MKLLKIALCVLLLQGCAGWKINGISKKDFQNRSPAKIILGVGSSFIVHELGHLAVAKMNGGGHWNGNIIKMDEYYNHSHNTQQLFHRAGFLSQLIVGGLLTFSPEFKHSDFTLGFNGFTTVNTALYTIGGGINKEASDIRQLDNGVLEGSLYTLGAGILTYINLEEK